MVLELGGEQHSRLNERIDVASRTIVGPLMEQVRVLLVPLFHGLHRRLAAQC